jgi:arylformamidase
MSTAIFRGYDKKALDAEYNNRVKVKDALDWVARYGAESARVRAELPMKFDVAYGPHHDERLDVFAAARSGPAPIQLFIHGGYWHRLDKADFSFVARAFRPAGALTVVVNYALIPAVDMDALVRQVRSAIAWVHRNARELGGDPDRIFVTGHSAGGHLVGMLLATDWRTFGAPADVLKGGCGVSGLYDLEPIRLCYLNDVLALTPESARRNSPLALTPPRPTPLILTDGGDEAGCDVAGQGRAGRDAGHGGPQSLLDRGGAGVAVQSPGPRHPGADGPGLTRATFC